MRYDRMAHAQGTGVEDTPAPTWGNAVQHHTRGEKAWGGVEN